MLGKKRSNFFPRVQSRSESDADTGPRIRITTEAMEVHDKLKSLLEKINKSGAGARRKAAHLESGQLMKIAGYLSNKTQLLETYLNLQSDAFMNLISEVDSPGSGSPELNQIRDELEEDPDSYKFNSSDATKLEHGNMKLDMKIVLTNADTCHALFSPVLTEFKPKKIHRTANFRTAIIIGPFYLEWNESSLVIPRRCFKLASVVASEAISIPCCYVSELVDRVASVIVQYNTRKTYSFTGTNCQAFVDDITQGIERVSNGLHDMAFLPLMRFMRRMRDCGELPAAIEHFRIQGYCPSSTESDRLAFHTHEQLDDFVHNFIAVRAKLHSEEQRNAVDIKNELNILRQFDIGFWRNYQRVMRLAAQLEQEEQQVQVAVDNNNNNNATTSTNGTTTSISAVDNRSSVGSTATSVSPSATATATATTTTTTTDASSDAVDLQQNLLRQQQQQLQVLIARYRPSNKGCPFAPSDSSKNALRIVIGPTTSLLVNKIVL